MRFDNKITVCKRCGIVTDVKRDIWFTELEEGTLVNLTMCKDCKFTIMNFLRVLFKKEK